ncbi:MAG: hypothetical protein U7123_26470 [Potamolinea sp.]
MSMQKQIATIALIIGSLWIGLGANSQSDASFAIPTDTKVKTDNTNKASAKKPTVGTVKSMVNGDLMCYVKLLDENRTEHNLGASFEICTKQKTFLNNKVRLTYQQVAVNDCQSAEPCGKTRQEFLITKMELIAEKPESSSNSQTLSNGKWTITIGNGNSWSGVNGTGNLTYRGCDDKGKCINLTGGKVTSRDGKLFRGWSNGEYFYIIEQTITEEESKSSTTLIVRKGSAVIMTATGFKVVASK